MLVNPASFRFHEPSLYAYLSPRRSEILYVAHASRGTLGRRFEFDARAMFDIVRRKRLKSVRVMVARLISDQHGRLSRSQLSEVSGLLAGRLNTLSPSVTSRREVTPCSLVVHCRGDWPYNQARYVRRRQGNVQCPA